MAKRSKAKKAPKMMQRGLLNLIRAKDGIAPLLRRSIRHLLKDFPVAKDDHSFHHFYSTPLWSINGRLRTYIELHEYLDISPSEQEYLRQDLYEIIDPKRNRTKGDFQKNSDDLLKHLKRSDVAVSKRLRALDGIECYRLEESMKCISARCNLSAVVMAVSAVEHRLHHIIKRSNPRMYAKEFERQTLGGIIQLFRHDAYKDKKYKKLKTLLPDKHKPLVEMLNIYRIFSAHPKDEIVTSQTAKVILSMSFLLLEDESLKI